MKDFYFQKLETAERSAREIRESIRSVMRSFSDDDLQEDIEICDLFLDLLFEEII